MPIMDPEARRKYHREWRAARRLAYLADKKCCICGSAEKLEIDHIDPGEKVTHNVWSWRLDRREAELAKCQILCHACHMVKTLSQRRKADHGGAQMYQVYKCRCDLCRQYKLNSSRKSRLAREQRELARKGGAA